MLSNLFYTINFTISIVTSVIGFIFGCLIVLTIIINRQCRTVANLLTCNTTVAMTFYTILLLISSIYGLSKDWLYYQPACIFRAYCITMICIVIVYSYLIQAISRLIVVVFYKYKHLQTYRFHCILITINWIIGNSIPFIMFLINNNIFVLVKEERVCVATSDIFAAATFCIISAYAIPLSIIIILYGIIFSHARQSSRRIIAITLRPTATVTISNGAVRNMKRELKLMKNIMIVLSLFTSAGTPYLALVLWQSIFKVSPPEPLYLLSLNSITISIVCMIIISFFINKDIKNVVLEYLRTFRQNELSI